MTDTRSPRTRLPLSVWVVTVALPLIVAAVAVALQLAWLPELPDPIAIHWGPDGAPDGFAPAWASIALTGGLALGLTGLFALILGLARGAGPTATHKLLAVVSLGEALFTGVLVTASVGLQRGVADASAAPDLGPWVAIGLGAAVLAGIAAWFALPPAVRPDADAVPARPIALAPGERGVWIATTRVSSGAVAIILVAVGVALAASVFAAVATDGALWPVLFVPLLLLVLVCIGVAWRVRVDASGLAVRSLPLGWPRVVIAAGDIAEVATEHVEPLAEFGGWGWRWAPGRSFGVVTRSGPAIRVTRRDGRRFTVTVDDAATGAGLLATSSSSATETGERGPQTGSARRDR
ncbi:DUF1648 domain-containing protein [Protaetiibacter mangrovi]|uniref:DUF1648 domain-containing protein n=1 Tax=Protaetiibacter mangrovi TaxID=2970926 RepID=A0ABT1ZEM0_9MICO|nr:DUF1648 domain-containing protein [Protaetiibacter mangrovi]MCS0499148.1 DUF1648 domain-containing protein [Protaetiibacter mangrovi]